MAGTAYNRLFNTKIMHDFYVDNISRKDLAVVPTDATVLAMKNSNMLFRNDEGGFRVLYKVDGAGAPFIDFSNVRLVFSLELLNVNEFLNFTKLTGYTPEKILYFTNIGSITASALNFSLIDYLRPVMFTYEFPQITGTVGHIKITDQNNVDVTPTYPNPNTISPNASNNYFYPIDFTKLPKGLYNFETWTDAVPTPTVTKTIYIDNDLASQGAFGIVDILATNGLDASFPGPPLSPDYRLYKMNFVRRETQWKYIVILKSASVNPTPPPIIILDESSPVQPVYGSLAFNLPVNATVDGYPARIITSVSTTIPYFEEPKKGLSVKNTALSATIITNIPGPPIGVVSAQKEPKNFGITEIFVII